MRTKHGELGGEIGQTMRLTGGGWELTPPFGRTNRLLLETGKVLVVLALRAILRRGRNENE